MTRATDQRNSERKRRMLASSAWCASGTGHNDGAKISAAVRAQQRANLLNNPGRGRRRRTPQEQSEEYYKQMAETRAARKGEAAE